MPMNEPPAQPERSNPDHAGTKPIRARLVDEESQRRSSEEVLRSEEIEPLRQPSEAPIEETNAAPPRRGSPFASEPISLPRDGPVEVLVAGGPVRYTAMGAVAASAMVLGFAAAAAWWFPGGGTMIAALGCGLSLFGLYSHYRATAAGLLLLHLALFIVSYGRSIG